MNAWIEGVNRTADAWGSYMVPAAWQAALVGLLLLAVVAIGRRWPSPIRFAILAIALAKFAIPPLAAVPSGVFSQFNAEGARYTDAVAAVTSGPSADAPREWRRPNLSMMADTRNLRVPKLQPIERPATEASSLPATLATTTTRADNPTCPSPSVKAYLMLTHLAGVLAMFCLIAVQYRRVLRVTYAAEQATDGPLHRQFLSLCRALGLRRKPRLLLASEGHQPFSFGTFRASVVLPRQLVSRLSVEQLRATLAHELAHHRRGDLWLNWLQAVLCAVWWFHPVLWLLNRAMRATREDCCDDLLLARDLVGGDAYCDTLLQVASLRVRSGNSPLVLTMSDSPHPLGRRFRRIMDTTLRRWPRLPWPAIAALVVLAAVLLPGLRSAGVAADASTASSAAIPAKKPSPTAGLIEKRTLITAFGNVTDPAGKPVAGATVYLREWVKIRASSVFDPKTSDILATRQTDSQGAFRFENVSVPSPPDRDRQYDIPWDVVAVAKSYAIAWRHLDAAQQQSKSLTIRLAPETKIIAEVTDEQSRPIRDAKVSVVAIQPTGTNGSGDEADPNEIDLEGSRLAPSAKTGPDGKATIAGLPRNVAVDVTFKHDNFRSDSFIDRIRVATANGPEPTSEEQVSAPLKISTVNHFTSGKIHAASFSVALEPPATRIVGRVIAADTKQPLAGVEIMPPISLSRFKGAMTDRDGRFILKDVYGPPCRFLVSAPKGSDYVGQLVLTDFPKEKKEVRLDIELARGEVLAGRVVDETGKGVSDFAVMLDTGLFGVGALTATKGGPYCGWERTDRDGRFRLIAPPGKAKVMVYSTGSTGRFHLTGPNGTDSKEVEVVAGKPTPELRFTAKRVPSNVELASDEPLVRTRRITTTVQGRVTDPEGKPVADAEVSMDPYMLAGEDNKPEQTDKDGRFSLRVTFDPRQKDGFPWAITAIQRTRKLCGHTVIVDNDAPKAASTPLEIHAVPTGTVAGRVLEGGKPVAGRSVKLYELRQMSVRNSYDLFCISLAETKTDGNGSFAFQSVEADKHKNLYISCEVNGYTRAECNAKVAAGQNLVLAPFLLLRLDQSVSGIVVDSDGNPVTGSYLAANARSDNSYLGSGTHRTRKDGRFTITRLPNVPLTITAYSGAKSSSKDGGSTLKVTVNAEPGQANVRIVLGTKPAGAKK